MNIPEIYESDYLDAVKKIHEQQSPLISPHPIVSIFCRTVKAYGKIISDNTDGSVVTSDYAQLNFRSDIPSMITGLRYWHLDTKIILVPDPKSSL